MSDDTVTGQVQRQEDSLLTDAQRERLTAQTMKGRHVWFKNKGLPGRRSIGKVVEEVYVIVGEYKHMIQRIEFDDGVSWDGSRYAYRTGYYTYQYGRKNIKWGQYTQFLTEKEYRELLGKARAAGWEII